MGAEGTGSWRPRIPFAICGLASVAFLLFWFARSRLTTAAWIALSVGLLGNVSFFLYCRQCRYYPLAFLLSLVIVYLYLNWDGRWSGIFGMMLASVLLLWTHYLPYAALYAALACDYLLFTRHRRRLKPGHWLLLLGPQLLLGILSVTLPLIHFFGQVPPGYFVAFGPFRREAEKRIAGLKDRGVRYQLVEVLDIYWQDLTRPEIFWRSFEPISRFNRQWEAVYVYRRVTQEQIP